MFIGIPCLHLSGDSHVDDHGQYPTVKVTLNSSMQLVIDEQYVDIETAITLYKQFLGLPTSQPRTYHSNRFHFGRNMAGDVILYKGYYSYTLTPTAKRILAKMFEVATGFCKEEVGLEFGEPE